MAARDGHDARGASGETRWRQPLPARRVRLARLFACLGVAGLLGPTPGCLAPIPELPTAEQPAPVRATPPRPERCDLEPASGAPLQPVLDAAPDAAIICLSPGVYPGGLRVTRPLTLWGPPAARLVSSGVGTTVNVLASDVALLGFTIDGSGDRFDVLDSALRVTGEDVRAEGLLITRATFGLLVEKSRRVTLRANAIEGDAESPYGLRGDPIRLWETHDSVVEGNVVTAGRDVVVWYSSDNRVVGNLVTDGRYGTHLMYSHRNVIEANRYRRNVVGIFLMYSREVVVRGNLLIDSGGPAGMGLGLKESGALTVEDNALLGNTVGVYIDTSPQHPDDHNRFAHNLVAFATDAGVVFHSSQARNRFTDNAFRDNRAQVRVQGNGNARGVAWERNAFDDYVGYDLDGDGFGDLPYELRSLAGDLVRRAPDLALLTGTPALWLIDAVTHIAPMLRPEVVLVDASPRMTPPVPRQVSARTSAPPGSP